jgi:hypothetical protein
MDSWTHAVHRPPSPTSKFKKAWHIKRIPKIHNSASVSPPASLWTMETQRVTNALPVLLRSVFFIVTWFSGEQKLETVLLLDSSFYPGQQAVSRAPDTWTETGDWTGWIHMNHGPSTRTQDSLEGLSKSTWETVLPHCCLELIAGRTSDASAAQSPPSLCHTRLSH